MVFAANADETLGSTQKESVASTLVAVQDISKIYQARARRFMAARGSYFADDPLIAADMPVCQQLLDGDSGK